MQVLSSMKNKKERKTKTCRALLKYDICLNKLPIATTNILKWNKKYKVEQSLANVVWTLTDFKYRRVRNSNRLSCALAQQLRSTTIIILHGYLIRPSCMRQLRSNWKDSLSTQDIYIINKLFTFLIPYTYWLIIRLHKKNLKKQKKKQFLTLICSSTLSSVTAQMRQTELQMRHFWKLLFKV